MVSLKQQYEKVRDKYPQSGQVYWFINSMLLPEANDFRGSQLNHAHYRTRNYFASKEECLKYCEKIIKFLQENNPPRQISN